MEKWRILSTPDLPGALNMAIDQTIADNISSGGFVPTIRFFSWNPFCLSLGKHQSINDVNLESCKKLNVDVIKRPTGGKAVFHATEFTYSVIIPAASKLFRKTIHETYLLIAEWLSDGLSEYGIKASLMPKLNLRQKKKISGNPSCFSSASDYEITINNKKLIGSAQRRWPGVVLQHGSLLIGNDYLKVSDLLNHSEEKRKKMLDVSKKKTTYLTELMSEIPDFEQFSDLMGKFWKKKFKVDVINESLSRAEMDKAEAIRKNFELFSN